MANAANIAPALASKNMRNEWGADQYVALMDGYSLRLATHKTFSGSLVTSATAGKLVKDDFGTMFTFAVCTDYSATIAANKVRVTEKAINAQHAAAIANVDEIKAAALAFYKKA